MLCRICQEEKETEDFSKGRRICKECLYLRQSQRRKELRKQGIKPNKKIEKNQNVDYTAKLQKMLAKSGRKSLIIKM